MMREPAGPSATPSAAASGAHADRPDGPSKPDYRPRNRLDPHYRPGAGGLTRNRPGCEPAPEPWMYGQRRQDTQRRIAPWQRGVAWIVWLAALGTAGYGGYSLTREEDVQAMVSPWYPPQGTVASPPVRRAESSAPLDAHDDLMADPAPDARTGIVDKVPDNIRRSYLQRSFMPAAASPASAGTATEAAGPAVVIAPSLTLESELHQAPLDASMTETQAQPDQNPAPAPAKPGMAVKTRQQESSALASSHCSEAQIAMQLCEDRSR